MFGPLFRILLLGALCITTLPSAAGFDGVLLTPTQTTALSQSQYLNPVGVSTTPLAIDRAVPLTTAQRLARGLPPNRPRTRARVRADNSPHPPRASQVCKQVRGNLAVALDGVLSGYVSSILNIFGEYGITTSRDAALLVSVPACPKSASHNTFFDVDILVGHRCTPARLVDGV